MSDENSISNSKWIFFVKNSHSSFLNRREGNYQKVYLKSFRKFLVKFAFFIINHGDLNSITISQLLFKYLKINYNKNHQKF